MPWYYAGPDAKPIGPISLEELRARVASGTVSTETYVLEQTGQPTEQLTWKRYRELFPASPVLPPLSAPPLPPTPHPLFPSASPVNSPRPVFAHPVGPDPYYATKKTNGWCIWGFGLGIASLPLLILCIGALLAPVAFVFCIIGLFQVHQRREEGGQGFAICGLLFSCVTLLITLIFLAVAIPKAVVQYKQTTTEQSTNDSE